jgi:hypothetical protein
VADLAEARNIRLLEYNEASDIFVMTSPRLLVGALVNLLFNAVKDACSDSSIEVRAPPRWAQIASLLGHLDPTKQRRPARHAKPYPFHARLWLGLAFCGYRYS